MAGGGSGRGGNGDAKGEDSVGEIGARCDRATVRVGELEGVAGEEGGVLTEG